MKGNGQISWLISFGICFFLLGKANAQLQQLPVDRAQSTQYTPNARVQQEKLRLPFWEDFSSGAVDSIKWTNHGATPSFTIGINPPSQGVLLLDGVDERGNPYSSSIRERGEGDRLISAEIDLSGLTQQELGSLFFSFFYQAGGKAEFPDEDDFLELYFADTLGNWHLIWDTPGGDLAKQSVFTQQTIPVPASFAHENFQFKFQNRGRLSGPFDGWLLDYIYLNTGRSASNTHFPDRAISKAPSSPLGRFGAVPFFEFQRNPEPYSGSISSQFNNLDIRFRAMEYSVQIRNAESGAILQQINTNTPFNPVPLARERREFTSNPLKSLVGIGEEGVELETVIYLTTGDNYLIKQIGTDTTYHQQVDFRVNDTIRQQLPLRDYFAYDNNSVDYSAGINQRSGMLAVRYHLEDEAYLNGISINFTNFAQGGSPIEILVWNDLDANPIYRKEHSVPHSEKLADFAYFPTDIPVRVSGNFFVGFMQFTNDFLHVGLDKSTDNGQEVFYNVVGSWEQNQTVEGSLMVRPHLQAQRPEEAQVPDTSAHLKAYPNPVTDRLFLEGALYDITVYDAFGRQINIPVEDYDQGKVLNFMGQQKGVYLIRTNINHKPTSLRILVK